MILESGDEVVAVPAAGRAGEAKGMRESEIFRCAPTSSISILELDQLCTDE